MHATNNENNIICYLLQNMIAKTVPTVIWYEQHTFKGSRWL